jgi:hypothetical protein
MGKGMGALRIVPDRCYSDAVERAFDAADSSTEPVQAGIEAAVMMAEHDPAGARAALWRLQTDWRTLDALEARLEYEPTQAALRVGAAIQVARSVLATSPAPQLRGRLPEVMEWVRPRELSAVD